MLRPGEMLLQAFLFLLQLLLPQMPLL